MKNFILALPLLLGSCGALPIGGGGDADEGTPAVAEAAGSTVGTLVTLGTGNPAIGAGAAAVAASVITLILKGRKKPTVRKK